MSTQKNLASCVERTELNNNFDVVNPAVGQLFFPRVVDSIAPDCKSCAIGVFFLWEMVDNNTTVCDGASAWD